MRRRDFIAGLAGAAALPLGARAQQPAVPVIGFLFPRSRTDIAARLAAFHNGLRETGFVEGQNVAIEYRFAEGQQARLPAFAADLVQRGVKVIVAASGGAPEAAKLATTTIPIVFDMAGDPVRDGLVPSLNRPGGNLTGVSRDNTGLAAKRFGLLREMVPQASAIYVLRPPAQSNSPFPAASAGGDFQEQELRRAGLSVGVPIRVVNVRNDDFDDAFAKLASERAGTLFVIASQYMLYHRQQIVALAARHRIPASYANREFAEAGGLMAYEPSQTDAWRQVGRYTGRILKGEKPADLPVMLPTKYEFVINLKTARALGLTIPETLLATADEVIQ
jgi:putative tryptophan/tyrosine transport system substrate-binding protein